MAERDRAAVGVDALRVDVERADGGQGDAREGLVDLPQVDVGGAQAVAGEQALRGLGGPQVQGGVRAGDDRPADDLDQRLEPRGAGAARRGDDARGAAVGELRGVARGDRAAGGRAQRAEALRRRGRPDALVAVELDAVDRHDLLRVPPRLRRRGGPGVRLGRERVLVGARDAEPLVLGVGELDHPGVLDRAVQAVVDHHVDHRLVAHRRGAADVDGVRGAGHRVEAADHRAGRLALADHARRQRHGAEAGQADVVDRDARHRARDAARERGAPAGVLAARRLEHVAEHDVVGLEPGGAVERRADRGGAELDARAVGEAAAEAPDRRPRARYQDRACALGHRRPGYARHGRPGADPAARHRGRPLRAGDRGRGQAARRRRPSCSASRWGSGGANMPAAMLLRSGRDWHLDAAGEHTLDAYIEAQGLDPDAHRPDPDRRLHRLRRLVRGAEGDRAAPRSGSAPSRAATAAGSRRGWRTARPSSPTSVVAAPGIANFAVEPALVRERARARPVVAHLPHGGVRGPARAAAA